MSFLLQPCNRWLNLSGLNLEFYLFKKKMFINFMFWLMSGNNVEFSTCCSFFIFSVLFYVLFVELVSSLIRDSCVGVFSTALKFWLLAFLHTTHIHILHRFAVPRYWNLLLLQQKWELLFLKKKKKKIA